MNKKLTAIAVLAAQLIMEAGSFAQPAASTSESPGKAAHPGISDPQIGIGWGFLYGYLNVRPEHYLPEMRTLGADFTKVYLFWSQIEPKEGQYDWRSVDAFVDQLNSPEEGLIALFSASQWATRQSAAMLPPSPAKNPDDYYRFVHDLVKHCKGRVRYWQNDCEPNNPIYWLGTKEEFTAQLKVFYKAVKDADPSAIVVAGGYDGLFGPPGTHQFPNQQVGLDFFDYVLKEGRGAFDLFDLRLYGDSYTIEARVQIMRQKMQALGYNKPIICAEYGGPAFFQFAENRKYAAMIYTWTQSINKTDANGLPSSDNASGGQIAELYKNMDSLAPQTQIFMVGCRPELEAKYDRIQARSLVMRNVFALSAGVNKTLYWQFADDRDNPSPLMRLMYGKVGLVGFENDAVKKRYPTADAFQRMTTHLSGVRGVKRIEIPGKPSIFLFQLDRGQKKPSFVVWERRDEFSGEDLPAVPFDFAWATTKATAVDELGQAVPVQITDGRLHLSISLTPIFVEPAD